MKNERQKLILFGSCFRTLAVILFHIFAFHGEQVSQMS